MKQALLVLALAVAPACGKHNDIDVLQREADAAAKFYAPQLDVLDARVQTIFKRGTSIPATTPGINAVTARLTEARDTIISLRGIVAPGADGKSAVQKQAAAAAKDRKVEELEKLIHTTNVSLEHGITVVSEDLASVESWIAYYDGKALAMTLPGSPPPSETGAAVPGGQPVPMGQVAPAGAAPAGAQREAGAGAAPAPAPAPTHR